MRIVSLALAAAARPVGANTVAQTPTVIRACVDSNVGARHQDRSNGTVTDSVTGLIWLKWTNRLPRAVCSQSGIVPGSPE